MKLPLSFQYTVYKDHLSRGQTTSNTSLLPNGLKSTSPSSCIFDPCCLKLALAVLPPSVTDKQQTVTRKEEANLEARIYSTCSYVLLIIPSPLDFGNCCINYLPCGLTILVA